MVGQRTQYREILGSDPQSSRLRCVLEQDTLTPEGSLQVNAQEYVAHD